MGWLLLILLAGAVLVVVIARKIEAARHFRGRQPLELRAIHQSIQESEGIRYDTLTAVFNMLGDIFSVDPRLIRPTDDMKSFAKLDSWTLDAGQEKLEKWLVRDLKIDTHDLALETVLDLLRVIEKGGDHP